MIAALISKEVLIGRLEQLDTMYSSFYDSNDFWRTLAGQCPYISGFLRTILEAFIINQVMDPKDRLISLDTNANQTLLYFKKKNDIELKKLPSEGKENLIA